MVHARCLTGFLIHLYYDNITEPCFSKLKLRFVNVIYILEEVFVSVFTIYRNFNKSPVFLYVSCPKFNTLNVFSISKY